MHQNMCTCKSEKYQTMDHLVVNRRNSEQSQKFCLKETTFSEGGTWVWLTIVHKQSGVSFGYVVHKTLMKVG